MLVASIVVVFFVSVADVPRCRLLFVVVGGWLLCGARCCCRCVLMNICIMCCLCVASHVLFVGVRRCGGCRLLLLRVGCVVVVVRCKVFAVCCGVLLLGCCGLLELCAGAPRCCCCCARLWCVGCGWLLLCVLLLYVVVVCWSCFFLLTRIQG